MNKRLVYMAMMSGAIGLGAMLAGTSQAASIPFNIDFESFALQSDGGAEFTGQAPWSEVNASGDDELDSDIVPDPAGKSGQVLKMTFHNNNGGPSLAGVKSDATQYDDASGTVYVNFDVYLSDAANERAQVFIGQNGSPARYLEAKFEDGLARISGGSNTTIEYYFKKDGANVALDSNTWYRVSGVLHIDTDNTKPPVSTFDLTLFQRDTDTALGAASGELLNDPVLINGQAYLYVSDGGTVYMDNLYYGAAPLPEPGSLSLLGLGGLMLLRRKRRS